MGHWLILEWASYLANVCKVAKWLFRNQGSEMSRPPCSPAPPPRSPADKERGCEKHQWKSESKKIRNQAQKLGLKFLCNLIQQKYYKTCKIILAVAHTLIRRNQHILHGIFSKLVFHFASFLVSIDFSACLLGESDVLQNFGLNFSSRLRFGPS